MICWIALLSLFLAACIGSSSVVPHFNNDQDELQMSAHVNALASRIQSPSLATIDLLKVIYREWIATSIHPTDLMEDSFNHFALDRIVYHCFQGHIERYKRSPSIFSWTTNPAPFRLTIEERWAIYHSFQFHNQNSIYLGIQGPQINEIVQDSIQLVLATRTPDDALLRDWLRYHCRVPLNQVARVLEIIRNNGFSTPLELLHVSNIARIWFANGFDYRSCVSATELGTLYFLRDILPRVNLTLLINWRYWTLERLIVASHVCWVYRSIVRREMFTESLRAHLRQRHQIWRFNPGLGGLNAMSETMMDPWIYYCSIVYATYLRNGVAIDREYTRQIRELLARNQSQTTLLRRIAILIVWNMVREAFSYRLEGTLELSAIPCTFWREEIQQNLLRDIQHDEFWRYHFRTVGPRVFVDYVQQMNITEGLLNPPYQLGLSWNLDIKDLIHSNWRNIHWGHSCQYARAGFNMGILNDRIRFLVLTCLCKVRQYCNSTQQRSQQLLNEFIGYDFLAHILDESTASSFVVFRRHYNLLHSANSVNLSIRNMIYLCIAAKVVESYNGDIASSLMHIGFINSNALEAQSAWNIVNGNRNADIHSAICMVTALMIYQDTNLNHEADIHWLRSWIEDIIGNEREGDVADLDEYLNCRSNAWRVSIPMFIEVMSSVNKFVFIPNRSIVDCIYRNLFVQGQVRHTNIINDMHLLGYCTEIRAAIRQFLHNNPNCTITEYVAFFKSHFHVNSDIFSEARVHAAALIAHVAWTVEAVGDDDITWL